MNACVESVCPSPMMPEALAPPVAIEPLGNPAREATRTGFARAWARLARVREKNAPAIVHVHAESFYAAVEQAENPRLKGRGVLVVGEGVVASASPEAASRGV